MIDYEVIVEQAISILPTEGLYRLAGRESHEELWLREVTEGFDQDDYEALIDALWDAEAELEEDLDTAKDLYISCRRYYTVDESVAAETLEDRLQSRMDRIHWLKDWVEEEMIIAQAEAQVE